MFSGIVLLLVLYCCCLYCTVFVCINEIVHVPLMFSGIVLLFRYCTVVVFIVQLFVLMRLFMFLSGLVVLYCCCLYCTAVVCIVVFCINEIVHVPLRFSGIVLFLSVLYCCCLYCTVVVIIVQLLSILRRLFMFLSCLVVLYCCFVLYCCCLYSTVVCINEIVHVPLRFSGIVLLLSVLYCCCLLLSLL